MSKIYIRMSFYSISQSALLPVLGSLNWVHEQSDWNLIRFREYSSNDQIEFIDLFSIEEANNVFIDNLYRKEDTITFFIIKPTLKDKTVNYIKRLGIAKTESDWSISFYYNDKELNNTDFIHIDKFFSKLYQSLPNKAGYVCYIDVGNTNNFIDDNGLDYNMLVNPFFKKNFFWHCITPPSVYEKYNTKEQLLGCPFYSIKELEEGHLDIQQFDEPLEITSEKNLQYLHRVRKYLSENNLYGHLFE